MAIEISGGMLSGRRPFYRQHLKGSNPRLNTYNGNFWDGVEFIDENGDLSYGYLGPDKLFTGSLIASEVRLSSGTVRKLYVYITFFDYYGRVPVGDESLSWNPWKLVDLNWPKIDPRTGKPFDQYFEWYSPLAE